MPSATDRSWVTASSGPRSKLKYSPLTTANISDDKFTSADLRHVYEVVSGTALDRSTPPQGVLGRRVPGSDPSDDGARWRPPGTALSPWRCHGALPFDAGTGDRHVTGAPFREIRAVYTDTTITVYQVLVSHRRRRDRGSDIRGAVQT